MLAKLGLRSMSFLERTRIEARFPEEEKFLDFLRKKNSHEEDENLGKVANLVGNYDN